MQIFRRWPVRFQVALLRMSGIRIGHNLILEPRVRMVRRRYAGKQGEIHIANHVYLSCGALLDAWNGSISIEQGASIGPYSMIYGQGGVVIGEQCLIAGHCRIFSSEHEVPGPSELIRSRPDILRPTRVERDVWLGAGVTVLGGVTIGQGSVIGAGAVVTENLPPYSKAVGVPARVIGHRL